MKKSLSIVTAVLFVCLGMHATERYVGGDISVLPLYEQHNSAYLTPTGSKINDLIVWLHDECQWNTFRVRIFVNPDASKEPAVCQTTDYVVALGKRIKAAGANFMLDFHYSDTWVDATHIQAPAAWKGASDAEMAQHVEDYTREVLTALKNAGATPDLVQVGNEIMYGLCGIKVHPYDNVNDNWPGYLGLLKAGCNTVRDLCPNAKIIIHSDRPTNKSYNKYYYQKLVDGGVDFDIIGLSYYPFWHGYLTAEQVASKSDKNNLVASINQLAKDFPSKMVQIVECAYNFQYWPTQGVNYDTQDVWPCSVAGQYNFVHDLVDALKPLPNVNGINYWFPEEAGNGDDTNWSTSKGTVIETWLNRGMWSAQKSSNGHAINKTAAVSGGKQPKDVCAPYYMAQFYDETTDVISPASDKQVVTKSIEDGQLIIRRGDKSYNVLGQIR